MSKQDEKLLPPTLKKARALLPYGFTALGAARAAAYYLRASTKVEEQVRARLEAEPGEQA